MTEHSERRFSGPRKAVAAGIIAASGLIAACQPSGAVESQKPTTLPTESPVPSLTTPTPSESATPSFEVSPTPSASTEVSPTPSAENIFSVDSLLTDLKTGGEALDKYKTPKIGVTELKTAYQALMDSPAKPEAAQFPNLFADVTNSKLDPAIRETHSLIAITIACRTINAHPQSLEAQIFGKDLTRYEIENILKTPDSLKLLTQALEGL